MSRRRLSPRERAHQRLLGMLGDASNFDQRALCLLDVTLYDDSGGVDLVSWDIEYIVEHIQRAKKFAAVLQSLEDEERARGELRLVRGRG